MRQRTSQTKTRPAKKTSVRAEEFVYERKGKRERETDSVGVKEEFVAAAVLPRSYDGC